MKSKFQDLGLTFAAPAALRPIAFEIPQALNPPQAMAATAKPSFQGARPGLLLPQSFEVPTFNRHNAPQLQIPQSTRPGFQ